MKRAVWLLLFAVCCFTVYPTKAQEDGWTNIWLRVGDEYVGGLEFGEIPQLISEENELPLTVLIYLKAGAYDAAELHVYETTRFMQDNIQEAVQIRGETRVRRLWQTRKKPVTSDLVDIDSVHFTPTLPPGEPHMFFFALSVREGEEVREYTQQFQVVYTDKRFVYTNNWEGLIGLYQIGLKLDHGYDLDRSIPEIGERNPSLALKLYRLNQLKKSRRPAERAADKTEEVFRHRGYEMRRVRTGGERDSVCVNAPLYVACLPIYPWESEYPAADTLRAQVQRETIRYLKDQ